MMHKNRITTQTGDKNATAEPIWAWRRALLPAVASLCLLLLFASPVSVFAESTVPSPTEVAVRLQKTYDAFNSMTADFTQTTTIKMSRRTRLGSGTVIMLKPGRMRWDYHVPDRQILISDGETINMYFEKNRQMITTSAQEYLQSDVTYAFFSGRGDILQDFEVTAMDDQAIPAGLLGIKLIPRSQQPQVNHLYLLTDKDSFFIKEIIIIDHFDTVTDISFDNIKINHENKGLDPSMFSFTPPPETEIIRQ